MTQNKHKATHDQLRGMTFSASVVQLSKALVCLLFSFVFFLAHKNIDTHAEKYTHVPHLSNPECNRQLCIVMTTSVRPTCVLHSSCDLKQWDHVSL